MTVATETPTLSRETHDALLAKAVSDATTATNSALERKTQEVAELTDKLEKLETDNAALTSDNERLNKELDTAQVSLKSATDEVASLKAEYEQAKEEARLKDVASKRVDQVKNLKLFPDEFITERASKWAELSDDSWGERIDEWTKAKPAAATGDTTTETASAMSGTSTQRDESTDSASKTQTPKRRAVLGLS